MDIHEYQAKEILSKYNVPVLPGSVALKPSEAVTAFDQLGTEKCVVKAHSPFSNTLLTSQVLNLFTILIIISLFDHKLVTLSVKVFFF